MSETSRIEKILHYSIQNGNLTGKELLIFGINGYANAILGCLEQEGYQVTAFLSNNGDAARFGFGDFQAYTPSEYLIPYRENTVILLCSKYHIEMLEQLHSFGYTDSQIIDMTEEGTDIIRDSEEAFEIASARVRRGYDLYIQLCGSQSHNTKLFVCPNKGTGDVYLACALLNDYLKENEISSYIIAVINNTCKKVVELFDFENIRVVSVNDCNDILAAWEFFGDELMNVKPLLFYGWRTYRHYLIDDFSDLTADDIFQYDVFEFRHRHEYEMHKDDPDDDYVENEFRRLGLIPGRTVVISPYAGFFKSYIDSSVWECLVESLIEKGYTVATNSAGESEPVIKGTVPVFFPYRYANSFLEYAGAFVALRSGLCDIVSRANCRKIIIYERKNNVARLHTFGLKRMGLCEDVIELEHDNNDEELKEYLMRLFD